MSETDKYLVEVENQWHPMTLTQMLEESMIGIDLRTNRKRRFTGLKDKNGVEIYEGDIVDLPTPIAYDTRHIKAEVVYESARFSLRLEPGERDGVLWSLWRKMHLATVIGNIYENPELLGGTDDTPRV